MLQTAVPVPLAVRGIHLVVMGQLAVMSLLFLVSIRLSATHSERPTDDRVSVPSSAQRR